MKKKEIILISTIIILIAVIIILTYLNTKKDEYSNKIIIEAEVLAIGDDYLLVTTKDDIDYLIDTKDTNYKIGDKLNLELKELNKEKNPIEALAEKITLITKIENNKIQENDILQEESSNTENNQITTNSQSPSKKETTSEEDIINYFNNLDSELTNYNNNATIGQSIKSKFVKCIDFIFYEGTIGGKTFDELTSTAKLKILKIALSIDSKIDNKIPGYKDSISTSYQNIKSKLVEKYLDITTTICNKDQELCINAKEGFKDLKSNFGLTWEIIKDIAGTGTTKLKNWYEIWRYN